MVSAREMADIGLGDLGVDDVDIRIELLDEKRRRFLTYTPYAPQLRFHGSAALERVLSGANQSGKSFACAMETAYHLTGRYPDWWTGNRVEPRVNEVTGIAEINVVVIGTDNKTVRDVLQKNIIGSVAGGFDDGVLHGSYIKKKTAISGGISQLVDNIQIDHISGCVCRLYFRSYEQGRSNLQAITVDAIYCDEEPPESVIGELKARLTATGGFMYMAFTPLSGMTALVQEFWRNDNADKFLVCMSMYESGHMDAARLRAAEARYANLGESERKARMFGIPSIGTGMVFPIESSELYGELPDVVPSNWLYINGLDFGRGEHPTAVVFGCYNPGQDMLYLYDCFETVNTSISENASKIRARGKWIPTAYPHDLLRVTGGDAPSGKLGSPDRKSVGYKYKEWYEDEGVTMTPEFAKTAEGSTRVEVGLTSLRQRMANGKLRVSKTMEEWFNQKDIYRYGEDNKPVKKKDHLMDCSRYLEIMLRYGISRLDSNNENEGVVLDDTDIFS